MWGGLLGVRDRGRCEHEHHGWPGASEEALRSERLGLGVEISEAQAEPGPDYQALEAF